MTCDQITVGWLSKNSLDRHRPMVMGMQVALFVIGCIFWVNTFTYNIAFEKQVWGGLAHAIPAKVWAASCMAAAALTINGLLKPIKSWMVAFGAAFHCLQFIVLSYSAAFDGGAFVIGIYASVFFLPLHLWLLIEAVRRA